MLCSLKDSEGDLWFGTYLGNISYYNTRNWRKLQIIELEKNELLDVRVFYEDKNKKIWIGTHAGVFVIDLASKKVIHHYDTSNSQLLENFVRSIAQDSEGRFWIGTFGGVGIYTAGYATGQEVQPIRRFLFQYD